MSEWQRWLDALSDPGTWDEVRARGLLVGLVALATTVAVMLSELTRMASGPIPYKLIPDLRPVLVFGLTAMVGGLASSGSGRRRGFLLYYLLVVHLVFAIDVSTIHWFSGAFTGPLFGTRVAPVRFAASVVAFGAALLLAARVHGAEVRRELADRGVPDEDLDGVGEALTTRVRRAVVPVGLAVGGLGLLVEAAGAVLNDASLPMAAGLVVGAVVLVLLAGTLAKLDAGRTSKD